MNLAYAQALMWRAITWPTGVADFLVQADPATREAFAATFAGTADFDAASRMEVYANAYYWRLHGVLTQNHPVTAWLLGEGHFRNIITDYLLAHPSADPDLRHLGERLPRYLSTHPSTRDHPELARVAAAESAMGRILHQRDHPAATREELTRLDATSWPNLRIRIHPSAQLLECGWDYTALADMRAAGERAPEFEDLPTHDALEPLLVWRQGFAVRRRRIPAPEAQALRLAQKGPRFGELCAQLSPDLRSLPACASQLARWLQIWVDSGLLCALEADPPLLDD